MWRAVLIAVAVGLLGGAGFFWLRQSSPGSQRPREGDSSSDMKAKAAELGALQAREEQIARTVWAKEKSAQRYGAVFDALWDAVNASSNKWDALASFVVSEVRFGDPTLDRRLAHAIELYSLASAARGHPPETWREFLRKRQAEGWQLAQLELRQTRFEVDPSGRSPRSTFYCSAHLTNSQAQVRAALEGDLLVEWNSAAGNSPPRVRQIDASGLALKLRRGAAPFREILSEQIAPPERSYFVDPLMVYDLDGDGLSEIILAASNLVFRRQAGGRFEASALCRHSPGLIFTAVLGDFDHDGATDFLCARFEGLVLFRGSREGRFDDPGQVVWTASPRLKYAQVLTCGDIDLDGDLDVWLGQYKVPYERGNMPTPYFDANDGHPGYLLINDGRGGFSDATAAAGLEKKRWRRCYSASFADLDGDRDLDLVLVSDFAGLDLFANDGRGHFTDATRAWVAESRGFGMAHALADFNRDGKLDLLMIGMNSPTADRLNHLRLVRDPRRDDLAAREAMTYGNRLFVSGAGARLLEQTSLSDSIARSGWSWGCSAFDFDNDGGIDVYVANGHETKQSVRDYEPEFWLHDIYAGHSQESIVATAYFGAKFAQTRSRGVSYGGYEKNRFFFNERGRGFVEIGHLLGVALEADSRNVVADDLDGDGRLDLLVTTFEVWPEVRQTLRVFKNAVEAPGNWIGFRFREEANGRSPIGTRVTLHSGDGVVTRQIVTGDSYRSQHANTLHFGLGPAQSVSRVQIQWVNGRSVTLTEPAINRYHAVGRP